MKVAVVTGICVEHDAISAATVEQASILAELDGVEEVTLVSQHHGRRERLRQVTILDAWTFVRHPAVTSADLVIFHWGIGYRLFDSLPLVARERRVVVYFQNVTPPELVDPHVRPAIEASLRQIQLPILTATPIWTPSQFNVETLLEWGYESSAVRLVPFPIERPPIAQHDGTRPPDAIRFLAVGRLVPAKGLHVLVEAVRRVVVELDGKASLVIAGSVPYSDAGYIAHLRGMISDPSLRGAVRISENPTDATLQRAFRRSDVLVSPSFHEGLCVPVVEAYRAGCRVIATTAGNLPNVVQPPDPLVEPGDPHALADAMVAMGRAILAGTSTQPPGVPGLIEMYGRANTRRTLQSLISEMVG